MPRLSVYYVQPQRLVLELLSFAYEKVIRRILPLDKTVLQASFSFDFS